MGKITYWEDLNVNYDHLIYQSIIIDKELIENLNINISNPEATLRLTCFSSQNYPNGTLIFESSKSQLFEILTSKFVVKTNFPFGAVHKRFHQSWGGDFYK